MGERLPGRADLPVEFDDRVLQGALLAARLGLGLVGRGALEEDDSAFAAFVDDIKRTRDAIPMRERASARLTDAFYERIARLCLDEYHLRGPGVLKRVAVIERRENEDQRPLDTVRGWVDEATQRGFLERRKRGQKFFEPGWRLRGRWEPPRR